jgi:hypothetical protein
VYLQTERQFQLKHVFMAILGVAVVSAFLGPFVRGLETVALVNLGIFAFAFALSFSFGAWSQHNLRRHVFAQWGEPEFNFRQPKEFWQRPRTIAWVFLNCLLVSGLRGLSPAMQA